MASLKRRSAWLFWVLAGRARVTGGRVEVMLRVVRLTTTLMSWSWRSAL